MVLMEIEILNKTKKGQITKYNYNFGKSVLVKYRSFGQKSKSWAKIKVLVKNSSLGQKSKFWSKIEVLHKYQVLVKNRSFGQKSKFGSKIENFIKSGTRRNPLVARPFICSLFPASRNACQNFIRYLIFFA